MVLPQAARNTWPVIQYWRLPAFNLEHAVLTVPVAAYSSLGVRAHVRLQRNSISATWRDLCVWRQRSPWREEGGVLARRLELFHAHLAIRFVVDLTYELSELQRRSHPN